MSSSYFYSVLFAIFFFLVSIFIFGLAYF